MGKTGKKRQVRKKTLRSNETWETTKTANLNKSPYGEGGKEKRGMFRKSSSGDPKTQNNWGQDHKVKNTCRRVKRE